VPEIVAARPNAWLQTRSGLAPNFLPALQRESRRELHLDLDLDLRALGLLPCLALPCLATSATSVSRPLTVCSIRADRRPPPDSDWSFTPRAFVCSTAAISRISTTPSPAPALHFVLQRPFRVPARQLSCASSLPVFPTSTSQPAVLSFAFSQQFVYSPISRCTRPRLPNAITKFRPGSLASAGGRYLSAILTTANCLSRFGPHLPVWELHAEIGRCSVRRVAALP
jgi:hypothetical protein